MSLEALLGGVDPDWYRSPEAASADGGTSLEATLPPELLRRARTSALGRRMLARWLLAADAAPHLFAPRADGGSSQLATQWPRDRLARLIRDLGVLAFAPAIRAEVGREPVRTLKRALGNGYLLALDKAVWDGKIERATDLRLRAALGAALAGAAQPDSAPADTGAADADLHALFDRQGRGELLAWARVRDAALGDWVRLQQPPEAAIPAHLPEKQVLFLYSHHEQRT